jgi:dienelactone hydrolase
MTVKRVDGNQLPIALIAHGKPPNGASMLDMQPTSLLGPARDMARRGWLAVIVMRRGFGQSDGPMAAPMTCNDTSFAQRFSADADDLQATLDLIAQRPDADATRAIAIGVSGGGAAVSALGARNPKNLVGVINVSGGLRFEGCPKEDALVAAFKEFGTSSRVPNLWIYAKNDSFFPPDVVDRMRGAFLDGGADAKLVMYEPFGKDGHSIFSNGRHQWRYHKLPTWQRRDVDELLQKLKIRNSTFVEQFLAAPAEKALVKSTTSDYVHMSWGFRTIEEARAQAVNGCRKQKPAERCVVVMENDKWLGIEPIGSPAASISQPLADEHGGMP